MVHTPQCGSSSVDPNFSCVCGETLEVELLPILGVVDLGLMRGIIETHPTNPLEFLYLETGQILLATSFSFILDG